ncbi:hypothetical protein [Pseudoxanthomonas sp. JBR18]|uniref:hypothetical protein n=1 Tax=Pseudoxanthomonas sp. JBR18 TaxID=2969308 RepID=UPI002305F63F|nr:hypothetical protein [Pseudoxanthomonas sp. JBR18]WCE05017.1 hypothetical protein PJ250_03275 [Pseudoxanthomonas sp. JBR18]
MKKRGRRVVSLVGLVMFLAWSFNSLALSCDHYPTRLRRAEDVYVIVPHEVLSRGHVLTPYSRIAGMPETYDLVRFEVLETLRGPRLRQLDLYCGSGCGDNRTRHSVFNVATPSADGRPRMIIACNVGPADDQADEDTKLALDDVRERAHR